MWDVGLPTMQARALADTPLGPLQASLHPTKASAFAVFSVYQSVTIRECWRVSFMKTYTSSEQAMQAVTYQ
ncbi:hypothetical protein GCM10009504_24200 [Pseudomonas laurentiana]|nr:hypothetical protein GCM10009504_24200 [Pseudomonas laurentiana]